MSDPDPNYKSYKEWNELGRRIHKGVKVKVYSEDMIPLFHKLQTYDPYRPYDWNPVPGLPHITGDYDDMPH